MKRWLTLSLALLFPLLLASSPAAALEVGEKAPDFELQTLDGKTVRLSDYQGRVVVLKLATTWCPSCKQQSEEVSEAGAFLKDSGVAFIEVFVQDSEKMVRKYLDKHEYPMENVALVDDGKVLKDYNVYLIPRLLVIGPDLTVRRDGSLISAKELTELIREELGSEG